MNNMEEKDLRKNREEQEFKIDIVTFVLSIIGFSIAWINMYLMTITPKLGSEILNTTVLAYLSIIFTTSIPCVAIGIKNRIWAYGYIIGFAGAGIPFAFIEIFIGLYTFSVTLLIFTIMYLIFWKAWRSLSSIKTISA